MSKIKYFIMLDLKYDDLEELIEITQDERIVKYMEELKKVNSNPKYRSLISEEEDELFIKNSLIQQGEKRGEKRGLNKGKYLEKLEIAKNLLRDKMSIDSISKYTGLSINQIKSITL